MKRVYLALFNILFFIYMEFVFHLAIFKGFNKRFFYIIGFSVVSGLISTLIMKLFNKKWYQIGSFIIVIITTIIYVAQLIHYVFYKSIFSIYSLLNGGGQIWQFAGEIFNKVL